ncbi:histidine phosphatase family protein [Sneathiella marina]|uniref:Histidine phosphatase family protein n=1 Tax=Sneathiella marina TaxID=2950108 RepID=A0ABY4W6Q7_9PROT|nr:histidine phosphatase family protein [Sneathiella marina]USG62848.1 histidine phosphatase family protein [Sneathiella marina]
MTELTLIRHGQAQTGATDEASYDRLSDLGHEQARWLGDYFRRSLDFDHILSGTLMRQIETAQSLGLSHVPFRQDKRLNELDYFGLAHSIKATHGVAFPETAEDFASHIPQVLEIWRTGDVQDGLESFDNFRSRILSALKDAATLDGRVLLVTSTGVIATLVALSLGLDIDMKSKMFLMVGHTSTHKFELQGDELHLTQFGATPHLDRPDRIYARTLA